MLAHFTLIVTCIHTHTHLLQWWYWSYWCIHLHPCSVGAAENWGSGQFLSVHQVCSHAEDGARAWCGKSKRVNKDYTIIFNFCNISISSVIMWWLTILMDLILMLTLMNSFNKLIIIMNGQCLVVTISCSIKLAAIIVIYGSMHIIICMASIINFVFSSIKDLLN